VKSSITKKLVLTWLAVMGIFLVITVFILNISARKSLKNTIMNNLYTESAIIEELHREQITSFSKNLNGADDMNAARDVFKLWFQDIYKLTDIGFASNIALALRMGQTRLAIITASDTPHEVDFKAVSSEEINKRLIEKQLFFRISGGESEYFAVSRPISDSRSSIQIWILSYLPVYQLDIMARDMSLKAFFSIGIALIVAIFLSIYLSRNISKPIKKLRDHAEKIASRDFKSRVDIKTGDEIESLAQAMNKIANDLNDYDLSQKRFLQNVSHEFKTPLMSIMGYAEGIRDGVIEDKEKAFNVMIGECERLQRLVNEVLFLSKLETIEDFYCFKAGKINNVIEEATDRIQNIINMAGITLQLRLDRDCMVYMDRHKILQAILNLLSNAVRYAKSYIVIETILAGKRVYIKVSDDGTGINEAEKEKIFERFYKGKKGNTGLGMTITKAIIDKHKGSISADNNSYGGAVFIITLPVIT
jgi:two-component system sensor histidine kinase CssS